MANIPIAVIIVTCLIAAIFILNSMFLLSSIIAWISVEFSGPIPHALGFILGILSLINAILSILMVGVERIKKSVALVFISTCIITFLASIGLFVPWVISYASFCQECSEPQQTFTCINECNDECCFMDTSRPLAIIFIVFSALTLLCSIVGICVAVPFLLYTSSAYSKKR